MATNYLKPQEPLKKIDKDTGDINYLYPLVTSDQVILEDGTRLNTALNELDKAEIVAEVLASIGGASGGDWKVLANVTTTEDVHSLEYEIEPVKEIALLFQTKLTTSSNSGKYHMIYINDKNFAETNQLYNNNFGAIELHVFLTGYMAIGTVGVGGQTNMNGDRLALTNAKITSGAITDSEATKIKITPQEVADNYMAGSRLIIVGR